MILRSTLEKVVESQVRRLSRIDTGLGREVTGYDNIGKHAFIVVGIRRAGKSTLMLQIQKTIHEKSMFINFEDPRLAGFDLNDFEKLADIAEEGGIETFFFDEIQEVNEWERFVRFKLDEGFRIFITGSNASLLSKELGSKLTGRHLSKELFPFSYDEFNEYFSFDRNYDSFYEYMIDGGFPEFIKSKNPEVLSQAFNDIVVRDITNRYGLRNSRPILELAVWLISNIGKPVSAGSLAKILQFKSVKTVNDYMGFLNDAYMFFFLRRFSYSEKSQMRNPRKVYCIDNGMITVNSRSFSKDNGRLLENLVFLELRRLYSDIYYFVETRECDFVVFDKKTPHSCIQVCWELTDDNKSREIDGLVEALEFFRKDNGYIITSNYKDKIVVGKKEIHVIPFHEWIINSSETR